MPLKFDQNGLQVQTFPEIVEGWKDVIRAALGPRAVFTEKNKNMMIATQAAEREFELQQVIEAIHAQRNPREAFGIGVDYALADFGLRRLPATRTRGAIVLAGEEGQEVAAGFLARVPNTQSAISTLAPVTLGSNNIGALLFDSALVAGNEFAATVDGEAVAVTYATSNLATLEEIATEIAAVGTVASASVVGNRLILIEGGAELAELEGIAVTGGTSQPEAEYAAAATVTAQATEPGPSPFAAGAYSESVTPAGLDFVTNPEDLVQGRAVEGDEAALDRLANSRQVGGSASVEAIRAGLLNIAGIRGGSVVHNPTGEEDGDGRPPYSTEVIADYDPLDLDLAQQVAETISGYLPGAGARAAGSPLVSLVNTVTRTVTDPYGGEHEVVHSQPDPVPVYVTIEREKGSDYPGDGDDQLIEAVLEYGKTQEVGADVLHWRVKQAAAAVGLPLIDLRVFIGLAADPTQEDNLAIATFSRASFDSSRIAVTS